ncbi:DUF2332 domain-containing protein [Nocardioides panacisoli]|uniref:DUF2332 domain-containing protein n=1 Tax=Nocardioides panacisoli TaxID=627624 RepID=UPI001C62EE37|nr:DUF2332 domain-containing protein [Nocardioides panacisoli]QYJ03432.1 DUF2332 domain-containing protein [Nocardioides panacisoli]
MEVLGSVANLYRDFAQYAVDSPCFVDWAEGVLEDPEVQDWITSLPEPKRQPNLVFAAARWHGVPAPGPYAGLRSALLADDGTIRATIGLRATQTNEVGRLATLMPAFGRISGGRPLALLEVGASAGLCLYPDLWGYRWQTGRGVRTFGPDRPVLECDVTGPVPLRFPPFEVHWRGGIDLHPLDVLDDDDVAWLTTLVWPEHEDRRRTLEQAIWMARTDPPHVRAGNLLTRLPRMLAEMREAAPEAVPVVFHSAVIAYLDDDDRARFARMMTDLVAEGRCHWISNEGRHVLPDVTASAPAPPGGQFVLGIDGQSVGHTHGHGRSLHWW